MNAPTIPARSRVPRTHLITGDRDHVSNTLRRAHTDGRLVAITNTEELPDNQVRLTAELYDPTPPCSRWEPTPPVVWLAIGVEVLIVVMALAAAAALVWLTIAAVLSVIALVTTVLAWIGTHLPLIGFCGLVPLLVWGSAAARCEGSHCGGCRR